MNTALPSLPRGSVVTVGAFDGLHRGHQAVLDDLVRAARHAERASVLVTFEPHPAQVVRPDRAPRRLTPGPERLEILAQAGIDYAVLLHFDAALAALSPAEFVRRILVDRCDCRELVIGPDHGFGRDRQGSVETLRSLGGELGFTVDVVPPVLVDGVAVSSTRIRERIAAGDLAGAAAALGRPYAVTGVVVAGEGRGRRLGVPTANLAVPEEKLLPPDGVYAVRVEWGGGIAGGMLNQGPRPTFHDGRRLLEAHLFGFDGDLYGRALRVTWVTRLREVRRFGSAEELQSQLAQDRHEAMAALDAAPVAHDFHRV